MTAPGHRAGRDVVAEVALQLGFARRFALSCGVCPEAVRAWLTGIVRFKAIDAKRLAASRARVMSSGPTRENPIDVDVRAVPSPEARFLTALGHTAEEIGVRMKLSPNTVATHLKRARMA